MDCRSRGFVDEFWECGTAADHSRRLHGHGRIPIELCHRYTGTEAIAGLCRDCGANFASPRSIWPTTCSDWHAETSKPLPWLIASHSRRPTRQPPQRTFQTVLQRQRAPHRPFLCFAEMHRVCRFDSVLFVRDLLRPASEAALDALVNEHAAEANNHQRAMFAASLHASLTLDEVRESVGRLGYPPETVQQTSDRHWTWATAKS